MLLSKPVKAVKIYETTETELTTGQSFDDRSESRKETRGPMVNLMAPC